MKEITKTISRLVLMVLSVVCMLMVSVSAEEYSDDSSSGDNSLYSLGLENAVSCEPEFYYATLEYNVTVSADTKELELNPVKSADSAEITDISGTQLSDDGTGTVSISVQAANGAVATYILHVTSDGTKETEAETQANDAEAKAKAESEKLAAESEAAAQSEQAAQLEQKAQQVTALQKENDDFASRLDTLMKVLYGLIAFAVILLFVIINQSLRNKDMKDEIKTLKGQVTESYEYARKEQNMRSDYYYAPVQNAPQQPMQNQQMNDMSGTVHAAFGNAPQKLQAQPMNTAAATREEAPVLSKKELKKQEKEAKKAAKKAKGKDVVPQMETAAPLQQPIYTQPPVQPQPMQSQPPVQPQPSVQPQQPAQPTMVQSSIEEPDVNVDMIDL